MTLNATIYRESDGRWTAELPSFPGCATSGETRDEALENLHNAAALYFSDDDRCEDLKTCERVLI